MLCAERRRDVGRDEPRQDDVLEGTRAEHLEGPLSEPPAEGQRPDLAERACATGVEADRARALDLIAYPGAYVRPSIRDFTRPPRQIVVSGRHPPREIAVTPRGPKAPVNGRLRAVAASETAL